MIRKYRIISSLIILIAVLSILSDINIAQATQGGAVGVQGGFAGTVSTGTGVAWLPNSGIRIHIRDGKGNKVSNTVDILHPISAAPGNGWTICTNTRFEGLSTVTVDGYGASLAWTPVVSGGGYVAASTSEIDAKSDPITRVTVSKETLAPSNNSLNDKRGVAIKQHLSGSTPPTLNKLNTGSNDSMQLLDKSKWNEWDYIIEDLIDIAYAADGQAEFDPVYSDNKIGSLIMSGAHGRGLFKLGFPYEMSAEGEPDIIQTLGKHGCVVCIEPIYFGVYENKSRTSMTSNIILGTPYNASQVINAGYWDPGDTYNGNTTIATHNGIMWSMYLNRDLVINNSIWLRAVTADDFFKDKVDDAVQNEDMQYSVGHSFMYFQFAQVSGDPDIPTYDDEPPDGVKPNPKPHPAPNADPNYPTPESPRIPLVPGEDPSKTRTVNIVKTYVIEHLDGTEEHVATFTRTKVPQTIRMLQEPEYKLVGPLLGIEGLTALDR